MKQLTQKLKDGSMQVLEVPVPDLTPGHVLVKNYYSLISAGTEGSTVAAARKSYVGKARERPQQVKQVLEKIKSDGLLQTYRAVMKKLDAYSPLGYSSVGEAVGLGVDVRSFMVGDLVACGGLTACHAEIVAVPENLCVKLARDSGSGNVDHLTMAAYNTLGAIAMQGVRQADLRLGETCAVIGLGLLGHLTSILLRASGVRVVGIDVNRDMVELARNYCAHLAFVGDDAGVEKRTLEFTNGIGCDAVIIAAASKSRDPINLAGALARKRGTIVIVGDVGTEFDREPHFYRKELTVKMSCSYGPGRYDPDYEQKGRDYPVGYVRWTEKRNMEAFQGMIAEGKIDLRYLTTHMFKLDEAPKAYDLILEKKQPYLGVLIEYDHDKRIETGKIPVCYSAPRIPHPASINIGFLGAGSYAQSHLLPNIPKHEKIILKGVMTNSSSSSRSVADRFGFEFCSGKAEDVVANDQINTVFVASRHDSHAKYVIACLRAGKNVFVEKPLCITADELNEVREVYNALADDNKAPLLTVGFNRRFSPLTGAAKSAIPSGPMSVMYRINAGPIPSDSWIHDKEVGGGRIVGEACHFVDYATYLVGTLPQSVYATAMQDPQHYSDTLIVALRFLDGSVAGIQYFANGSKGLPKEYVEVNSHGITAVLKDFRQLEIFGNGAPTKKKLFTQDKGQHNEVKTFIEAILNGGPPPIPAEEIFSATQVTLKVVESLLTGLPIILR